MKKLILIKLIAIAVIFLALSSCGGERGYLERAVAKEIFGNSPGVKVYKVELFKENEHVYTGKIYYQCGSYPKHYSQDVYIQVDADDPKIFKYTNGNGQQLD